MARLFIKKGIGMGRRTILSWSAFFGMITTFSIMGQNKPLQDTLLSASDNELFSAERVERESWYSKTLDLTMHLWADLDMLNREVAALLPDQIELIFNASLGKMIHLRWCLTELKNKHSTVENLEYLIRIVRSIETLCKQLVTQPLLAPRIESTQELLRDIHESAITP